MSESESKPAETKPTETPSKEEEEDEVPTNKNREGQKADFEGFLQKKAPKGLIKGWKKRYFRLYDSEGVLSYFKSEKDFQEIGSIDLKGGFAVEKTSDKPNGFAITMKTSTRVWMLAADKPTTSDDWISKISKHFAQASNNKEIQPPLPDPDHTASIRYYLHPTAVGAAEIPMDDGDVGICVYRTQKAFLHEMRKVQLDDEKTVWINNLPLTVDEKTIQVRSVSDESSFVVEQDFFHHAKTQSDLLRMIRGMNVKVEAPRDAKFADPRIFEGKVAYDAEQSTFVLENEATQTFHFLNTNDAVTFQLTEKPEKPIHIREPSLRVVMRSEKNDHLLKIRYSASSGFQWTAAYTAILDAAEKEVEFTGWLQVKNTTGRDFKNAWIVAVEDPLPEKKEEEAAASKGIGMLSKVKSLGSSAPKEDNLLRTYKFWAPEKTTLWSHATKQFKLAASKIAAPSFDLVYFNTPKPNIKPQTADSLGAELMTVPAVCAVQFVNSKDTGLGMELPGGSVTIGRLEHTASATDELSVASISRTDPGELITLPCWKIPKVNATRKQTGFLFDPEKWIMVESFEISITNARMEPVSLTVQDTMYRWQQWEITTSSFPFKNHENHNRVVTWKLNVKPLHTETIAYTVFYSKFTIPLPPKKD